MRFSDDDLQPFAAWSSDRNPLHVDAAFARSTPFGRPIVHGMLSVIGALETLLRASDPPLTGLDIEFRGAVLPGFEYQVEATQSSSDLSLTVRGEVNEVLSLRGFFDKPEGGESPVDLSWISELARRDPAAASKTRTEPAVREVGELEAGVEVLGIYRTAKAAGIQHASAGNRGVETQVLALCSYIVGMELPGLRSLFTRANIRFSPHTPNPRSGFWYRARTLRFDRHFRILDTQVDVATPDGQPVATCLLRSYVPFGRVGIDVATLAAHLSPSTRRFQGLVALVCGGSRGLGADISAALALAGCHVYVAARGGPETVDELSKALAPSGRSVEFIQGDVGDAAWCAHAVERIRAVRGRLDLLILNACGAPNVLRVGPGAAAMHAAYVRENLLLVEAPLSACLPLLADAGGSTAFISSSFVEGAPAGLSHYAALKHAGEGLIRAAQREAPNTAALIARPPRLQTSWNDTPTGAAGAIPTVWAALGIVNGLAERHGSSNVGVVSDFPAFEALPAVSSAQAGHAAFPLRVCASFTTDPLLPALRFWLQEIGAGDGVVVAPYGQVLQTLLDPNSAFAERRGMNILLLRVRDWLRELPPKRAASIDFVRTYLQKTARDIERAVKSHRARAAAETLLLFCPSYGTASAAESILLRQTEDDLIAALQGIPGLQVLRATDYHATYGVDEDHIGDSVREKLAHIPYRDSYYRTLATIVARHAHRRLVPARKAVVVDCDNTLWRGVVGEVGAEGVEFDPCHTALHELLARLVKSGVLVCLCSKNEEADVWRVFETRSELRLSREDVVAAAINWQPKSENLRSLAARLNLGLDSFIFVDDNPVECGEVRSRCPEVLTLQWPLDSSRALRLLEHTWEFDPSTATAEDQRRTQMYREEFRRQELRDDALTFADFISNLDLDVEIAPLTTEDLRRASQLTLRTNQFNFTTRRRDETELQALMTAGTHEIRTIRVRDRFGDYGLVGLLVAEPESDVLLTDTFLLSCRVLGRGAEHYIAAELGRLAVVRNLRTVRMRVETTNRNTPARKFLESIAAGHGRGDAQLLECDFQADVLAALRFEPSEPPAYVPEEESGTPKSSGAAGRSTEQLRRRESQIERTAYELSEPLALESAIGGGLASAKQPGASGTQASRKGTRKAATNHEVATAVHEAFASALRMPVDRVKEVDALEALGCDSLRIVEITVTLLEKYPWLPSTLLFEHKSVSAIVREVSALAARDQMAEASADEHQLDNRSESAGVQPQTSADIAVVGLHVRCAGANSPDELWDLLSDGRSAVQEVDPDRPQFLHPLTDSRPHWAGLLNDVARFDAEFFGISPREAEMMDPQLRLFLEVAWSALEDAGCVGADHETATGVFAGVMYGDYGHPANAGAQMAGSSYRSWEGFSLANRLSQIFGFRGPSIAVDTACSSSGTALHIASQALNAGDCRVAVVGGVNLILDPDRFGSLGRLGILSARGRCEPFGADADGTVLGEGAGVVVLRPLADALSRGDRIYGVIKGTGLSTGSGTVGFTAPNPQAQAEAIERCVRAAKIDPRTITYVEAHGTGTVLGDPIEVRGLTLAYAKSELHDPAFEIAPHRRIGSIKPNIGHLEAGAGILGLIKLLLQMDRGMLLPSITSEKPNPHLPVSGIGDPGSGTFEVQKTLQPWERLTVDVDGTQVVFPRRAGLSSFGVGGANAHVIVEEAPARAQAAWKGVDRPAHVVTLSARSEESLYRQVGALRDWLIAHPESDLADVSYTTNVGRKHFEHRVALPFGDRAQLLASIEAVVGRAESPAVIRGEARPGASRKVAFLFTGQGSQYAGMGKALYDTQPVFRDALDRCAIIFDRLLGQPLLDLLFADEGSHKAGLLNETGFTQPALFAFEYALAELWRSWGITPDLVMGHSVGELTAMCIAGGVSLDDGLKLIAARGRLMQALPPGGTMTSVMAAEGRVQEAIAGSEDVVAIAAINAPGQVVISGAGVAVAEITARLEADGIKTKALTVSHAFHSPLMRPMVAQYEAVVREVRFTQPHVPFVSCVDGTLASEQLTTPEYWIRNITDPVLFTNGMKALEAEKVDTFIEIGPQPVLLGMGRQCVADPDASVWLPSLRKDANPWQTMLAALSRLHVDGAAVDWRGFDAPYARRLISLPPYAFDTTQYWLGHELLESLHRGAVSAAESRTDTNTAEASKATHAVGVYEVVWRESPARAEARQVAPKRWVVFADGAGVGVQLAGVLSTEDHTATLVFPGEQFGKAWDGTLTVNPRDPQGFELLLKELGHVGDPPAIAYLWGLDAPLEPTSAHAVGALHLVQAVAKAGITGCRVWLITRSAVSVDGGVPLAPSQSMLWGLGRTVALEHPDIWGGLIDLSDERDIPSVATELSGVTGEEVAFSGRRRYVARLQQHRSIGPARPALDQSGTYLITGGTGALGLRVASWAAERGARRLVLASRKRAPEAKNVVAAFREAGVTIDVVAADVTKPADVEALLSRIAGSGAPLRGVVHAAGIDAVMPLRRMTANDFEAILAPKASGAWLLHEGTKSLNLDLFVCFSSMASVLGSQGRAHYSAGNAFMDALMLDRRRMGQHGLSVNWGPWAGGGMATSEQLEQYARIGNHGVSPDKALAALDGMVMSNMGQAMVVDIEWPRFREAYEAKGPRPLLSLMRDQRSRLSAAGAPAVERRPDTPPAISTTTPVIPAQPAASRPGSVDPTSAPWVTKLLAIAARDRGTVVAALLRQEVSATLGFDRVESVPIDRPFSSLGMDSLMMAEFIGRLGKRVGLPTSALVFEHPSVRALAPKLLDALAPRLNDAAPTTITPQVGPAAAAARAPQVPAGIAGISGYSTVNDEALLAFQKAVFPDRKPDLILPRWQWSFMDSARRLGREPRTWLCHDGGLLVAHMGAIPVRLKVGSAERDTAWLVDTMVLASHRSQALGSKLMLQAHDDVPFSLSLGQSAEMREIQFKLGWKQVAPLQIAQFLTRPEKVLKGRLGGPGAWAASIGWRATSVMREALRGRSQMSLRETNRFDQRHDQLWRAMARDLVCSVVRDASFLNWKYVDQPGQRFVRLEVLDGDALRGILILMVREPDAAYSYRRAFLVDVVAPLRDEDVLNQLLQLATEASGDLGADSLLFMHTDKRLTQAAKASGFHLRPPARVVLVDPGGLSEAERTLVLDGANWHVTQGDSDIDRPGAA